MKKNFLKLALAVLTVGLLGSCSKLNERLDNLDKRVDGIENNQIASIEQQIAGINTSINDLKSADAAVNSKIAELKKTAEAQQTLIDALKEADQAIGRKDDELEGRIVILEGQDDVIAGQIEALEDADKAINVRIANLKSYVDAELVKVNDWAKATFATLAQYQQTADDLAALSVTVSGISTTLSEVQTSIAGLDTKIDGIDAALQGKIAEAKTEFEGKIAALRTELEGKIASAISTSETSLKGWVNNKLGAYYTAAQMDAKIVGLRSEINNLKSDEETGKSKTAELETKLTQLNQDLAAAKTNIKAAYEAAIDEAINTNNGIINQTIETKISEVNVTITNLTGRVTVLEEEVRILTGRMDVAEEKINTIEQQIEAINQSISDLETIRTNIQKLMEAKEAMGEDISELQAKDQDLEGKITDLENYVDAELAKYATTDWANATFATLEKQAEIIADVAKLEQDLKGLDDKLDQAVAGIKANLDKAITDLRSSLQEWVNEKLTAYYTKAEIDEKIAALQAEIADLKNRDAANSSKIETLEENLAQLKDDLEVAKATIEADYKEAIREAIDENNGIINRTIDEKIDQVNATIANLTGRVDELALAASTLQADVAALKAMIQSVSITPAYSDGSVEADKNGILTIKCIVSPAEALDGIESLKDSLLIYADYVKVKTKSSPAYTEITVSEATVLDDEQGAITLKADISEYLPKGTDKALTVALKIKNGISNYTTEFVPVYVAPGPVLPAGALPGKFSVSADKKVYFSKGNLYYDGSNWGFEAEQYYFRTYNGNGKYDANGYSTSSGTASGHWGLFGWVGASSTAFTSSPEIYGVSISGANSDYGNSDSDALKADWGTAIDDKGTWRTLTHEEWCYLFDNHVKVWGQCNSVNGYFIAPDGYEGDATALTSAVTDWASAEAAGIVFLPAAGYRYDSRVYDVGNCGIYWSSTASDSFTAYSVTLTSFFVELDFGNSRSDGISVRLVTDASATPAPTPTTKGTAKATIGGSEVDVNWVQLWANGPKFAEYNVGATSATEYGGYYCWGGLYENGTGIPWNDDHNTGDAPLIGPDDTATKLWGSHWRMPTDAELQGLIDNCTVELTQVNSVNGRKFTGKGAYASNSVFLPAAGYCDGGTANCQGSWGLYWSSTPLDSIYVYYLRFVSGDPYMSNNSRSNCGYSVRAVLAE